MACHTKILTFIYYNIAEKNNNFFKYFANITKVLYIYIYAQNIARQANQQNNKIGCI